MVVDQTFNNMKEIIQSLKIANPSIAQLLKGHSIELYISQHNEMKKNFDYAFESLLSWQRASLEQVTKFSDSVPLNAFFQKRAYLL